MVDLAESMTDRITIARNSANAGASPTIPHALTDRPILQTWPRIPRTSTRSSTATKDLLSRATEDRPHDILRGALGARIVGSSVALLPPPVPPAPQEHAE